MNALQTEEHISAHNYTNLFQQAPTPIAILKGREMRYVFINEAYAKIFPQREILGKTLPEAFPEIDNHFYMEVLRQVFDTGVPFNGNEVPAVIDVENNGQLTTRYFNLVYTPYTDNTGNIEGVMAFGNDVTTQVLAKQQTEKNETELRNIVLQAPFAMCVLKGPTFIVEVANEPMYRLWGREKELLLGRPIFEGLPEAKGQGFEEILNEVMTSGKRVTANERQVTLPRGNRQEIHYVNFVYQPLKVDQEVSGVIAVAMDVTEQVEARQKVEYAEERARLAIDSAGLGAYEVNLLTNEMFVTPRFREIWGFQHYTTDRQEYAAVICEEDLPVRQKAHQDSLTTGNLEYEARIRWRDGSIHWIRVKGKLLYDQGTPVRLLGVIQDITDQHLFEEELSRQVLERTSDLIESNERLERSNRELEQFAYVASHDLQEPLRKIQLFNNFALEQPDLRDETRKYISKVNEAATRMGGLIKDLLEYSRLSQDSRVFEKTDLNQVLKNVLTDFELLIAQKQAVIQADDLPEIESLPFQMNQLFFNLIGNSLKFVRRDVHPRIRIMCEMIDSGARQGYQQLRAGQDYVMITISDNGIGFDQEYADRIFTIFQRLNEKNLYSGYGIGLALCRKIIENHAGMIFAEGSPSHGAAFRIILPRSQTTA